MMKDIFSNEFKKNCYLDICEILSFVEDLMPNLEKWQMTKSVFIDDCKKITYKTIKDKEGVLSGYEVQIEAFLDKFYRYNLILKENMVDLSINYIEDGKSCKERYKTFLGNNVRRLCLYKKGSNLYKYVGEGESSESLYCIGSKFKKMASLLGNEEKVKVLKR